MKRSDSVQNMDKSPKPGFGMSPRSPNNFESSFNQAESDSRNKKAVKSVNPRLKTTGHKTSISSKLDCEIEDIKAQKADKLQTDVDSIIRSANKSK